MQSHNWLFCLLYTTSSFTVCRKTNWNWNEISTWPNPKAFYQLPPMWVWRICPCVYCFNFNHWKLMACNQLKLGLYYLSWYFLHVLIHFSPVWSPFSLSLSLNKMSSFFVFRIVRICKSNGTQQCPIQINILSVYEAKTRWTRTTTTKVFTSRPYSPSGMDGKKQITATQINGCL